LFEPVQPELYITYQGFATGAILTSDVDSATTLTARVAADQPLTNNASAGPARLAMALGFDFGTVDVGNAAALAITIGLQTEAPVAVEPEIDAVLAPSLRAIGPLPFSSSLRIAFAVPAAGPVRLEVFDVRGRRVRRLADADMTPGHHEVVWDGRDDHGRVQGAGLYFVRLHSQAGERSLRVVRVQ
jgi:hypothetical protein